jgi:hypothetical protein
LEFIVRAAINPPLPHRIVLIQAEFAHEEVQVHVVTGHAPRLPMR